MRYHLLVLEGPHDLEFVGRYLRKIFGFKRVEHAAELSDTVIVNLIPRQYPPGGNILRRVPVPAFFKNEDQFVVVQTARAWEKLATTAFDLVDSFDDCIFESVGLIADADNDQCPEKRCSDYAVQLSQLQPECSYLPGEIAGTQPRVGVYILPDNENPGTLENVLLECGNEAYSTIITAAEKYVDSVSDNVLGLRKKDSQQFAAPAGKNKAVVGAVGSVLRPGKAIQMSIHDNQWISNKTFHLPSVQQFKKFLEELLGLEPVKS